MLNFKKPTCKDPVLNINSSEFEVNKWLISEFVVNKLVPVAGVHPFPLDELMLMSSAVCRFKPELIFEWGTNIGKSARIFYEIINTFKINCKIHSVDLPDYAFHNEHPKKNRGKLVRDIDKITLHQGDGLTTSLEICHKEKSGGNILFFIDGDHSYESVNTELKTINKEIPQAIVLLHDTFYQSGDSGYNIGPRRAVNDAMNMTNYKEISTNTGLPGMTLLYKQ